MDDLEPTDPELEERLRAERPVPRAGFRAQLRAALREDEPSATVSPRLRRAVIAYAVSGAFLLTIAGAGLAGLGPFAA
jgi:hypothetical protein